YIYLLNGAPRSISHPRCAPLPAVGARRLACWTTLSRCAGLRSTVAGLDLDRRRGCMRLPAQWIGAISRHARKLAGATWRAWCRLGQVNAQEAITIRRDHIILLNRRWQRDIHMEEAIAHLGRMEAGRFIVVGVVATHAIDDQRVWVERDLDVVFLDTRDFELDEHGGVCLVHVHRRPPGCGGV